MKPRKGSAVEYEIAVYMAQELYPMDRAKREEYVKYQLGPDTFELHRIRTSASTANKEGNNV